MHKYFTMEEAEALLPELTKTMTAARDLRRSLEEKKALWEAAQGPAERALLRARAEFCVSQIDQCLRAVAARGAVPKDLEFGLLDFPARINGKEGYLCWRLGEDRIRYWHGLTEGFSGRKPLDLTPLKK